MMEMDREGVDITEFEKMGWHAAPTTELSLSNVKVPLQNLIGRAGRGFYQSIERALEYAKSREAFGHKIGTLQAISHKLAEMATKIEASRLLVYKGAFQVDKQGRADSKLSSMAKWYPARIAVEVSDEAIEILGGHGYMTENEVEMFYRDARSLELVEGTGEIHKNTIARSLLGKLG